MKVLITGVKGFLGVNLAEHFLGKEGCSVVGVSRDPKDSYERHVVDGLSKKGGERFRFQSGDLTEAMPLKKLLDDEKPDLILNAAAKTTAAKDSDHPYGFFKDNIEGLMNLLEWIRHGHLETRMVHFSTEAVFKKMDAEGKFDGKMRPRNLYSASKAAAEQYVYAYTRCFDEKVQVLRLANNYGPYQSVRNKIVAKTIFRGLTDEPFRIYPEATPPIKRWWMDVADTCSAVDRVLESGEPNGAYNVVGGEQLTVSDAVGRILSQMGKDRLLEGYVEGRSLDEEEYFLDGSELAKLGWAPKRDFDGGIRETVGWYRQNLPWIAGGKT